MPVRELIDAAETLARAQREVGNDLARRVETCRATVSIVRLLEACGEAQLGQVAAVLRVDLSVASRQVSQAVHDGHVERTVGTADRRVRTLRLTPSGHELAARLRTELAERAGITLGDWDTDELRATADTLRRLADAITTRTPGHPARTTDES
ncbi:MarR family winged helix-turn-helix transcriptional regulator [Cellulomonas soli]